MCIVLILSFHNLWKGLDAVEQGRLLLMSVNVRFDLQCVDLSHRKYMKSHGLSGSSLIFELKHIITLFPCCDRLLIKCPKLQNRVFTKCVFSVAASLVHPLSWVPL